MSISLPHRDDVERWSVEQVAAWYQQKEMADAANIYLRQGIDGHQMMTLPESKLVALFWEFSIRKRAHILNIINEIKSQPIIPHRKSHAARFANQNLKQCSTSSIVLSTSSSRYVSHNTSSLSKVGNNNVELEDHKDFPYADESTNEGYLVPLSAGAMIVMASPPSPSKGIKKDRCPSPSQNELMDKNCIKENCEELNAYEIISENPSTECETLKLNLLDDKGALTKPPDLPNRNLILSPAVPSTGNNVIPLVPPRTKSSQHQKTNVFHHQSPRGIATRTPPSVSKDIKSGISSVLQHNTPLPQPPKTIGTVGHKSVDVIASGSSAKKIISNPVLNSSTVSSIQQPSQLINLSSKGVINLAVSSGSKNRITKVNGTLDLGSGKTVQMNRLYESLLQENYFHPVVRNVLPSLFFKDRMFLVRPSTHSQHPLTLSLQEHEKIFNISIRIRMDGKYSLGTEKTGEMAFTTVREMIEWHRREPIKLEDGSLTYLTFSPPKAKPIVR